MADHRHLPSKRQAEVEHRSAAVALNQSPHSVLSHSQHGLSGGGGGSQGVLRNIALHGGVTLHPHLKEK